LFGTGGHTEDVSCVRFGSDGTVLYSSSFEDNLIQVWDWATGSITQTLSGHTSPVNKVAVSPDGRTLASASDDMSLKLWNLTSGTVMHTLNHTDAVRGVAWHPNCLQLATTGANGMLTYWTVDGELITSVLAIPNDNPVNSIPANGVAWSPDGLLVAVAGDDYIVRIYNAVTKDLVYELLGHYNKVYGVEFHKDSNMLLSTSHDFRIFIWDMRLGTLLGEPLSGHYWGCEEASFSPTDSHIVSVSDDKRVLLWDFQMVGPDMYIHGEQLVGTSGV